VNVHGQHITASQSADDAQVYLPSCNRAPPLPSSYGHVCGSQRSAAQRGQVLAFAYWPGRSSGPLDTALQLTSFSNNNLGCRPLSVESVAQQSASRSCNNSPPQSRLTAPSMGSLLSALPKLWASTSLPTAALQSDWQAKLGAGQAGFPVCQPPPFVSFWPWVCLCQLWHQHAPLCC
jgi:hypothetical protein